MTSWQERSGVAGVEAVLICRPADCLGALGVALSITGVGRSELACHGDTVFGTARC